MKLISKRKICISICICAYIVLFIYLEVHSENVSQQKIPHKSIAPVIEAIKSLPPSIDPRTKTESCVVNGPLPDHACTPGAIFKDAKLTDICVDGYTKTVRNVPTALKKKIYGAYSIPYPQPFGSYELDHLISLSIGGSNDVANLFPEAAAPGPGFPEKDVVENFLHREVCAGTIDLATAQAAIASDWTAIYEKIDPADIAELKAQFKNWASKGGSE